MNKVEEVLEVDKIRQNIKKFTKTIIAKQKIELLTPSSDFNFVKKELNKLNQALKVINLYGDFPIRSELDMFETINFAKKGNVFNEITLNNIKEEIQVTIDTIKYSLSITEDFDDLNELFMSLKANEKLYNEINSAISIDNTVKDSASKTLFDIRKSIYSLNKNIHTTLNKLFSKHKDKLSGDNFVLRNGHYAIPVNSSFKSNFDGIVQDVSDSGLTTFIEPKEILELENELAVLKIKERDEINKILFALTNKVVEEGNYLINNNEVLGELDFLSAKVKYAKEIDANIPKLNKEKTFKLFNARHPLIDKNFCVPNDFILGNDKTLMIISGPNAGGKTIALKTIAICSYMVKLCLAIPASVDSEICVFDKTYVEIGDKQSIESNLSTFSAHISSISVIFQYLTSNDLVVIDELCNGTDPKEGEALAVAIVKKLLKIRALTIVSSHYELLKKYGFTNKQILNASFIFNEKNVTPTFKILLGVSGKSYGFLISKKYGLENDIIAEAKRIYEDSFASEDDKKLHALDEKERYLATKEEKLKVRQESLNREKENLNRLNKDLKEKEIKLKNSKIDKFDTYLNDKYNEINNIYNAFIKDKDIKKAEAKLDKINLNKKKNENIAVGNYVSLKNLGIIGKVVSENGNKITISSSDGFTVKATKDQCELIEPPKDTLKPQIDADKYILNQKPISSSINLVGYRVDDATIALDKYLDDCVLKGLKEVKVIHGYGSGKLREGIHKFLKTRKNVQSFRIGSELDGGSGSTIVTLK